MDTADYIIAIWNGVSTGTKNTIDYAKRVGKKVKLFLIDVTGVELMPANLGNDCLGVGNCCDECDFLKCWMEEDFLKRCNSCQMDYCPRKLS